MLEDALASDRVIAIAQLDERRPIDALGRPAIRSIGCAGLVVWHEALPEGKYNIVLQGAARMRLGRELPQLHAYREFKAELLVDRPYSGPEEALVRQAVLELAAHLPKEVGERLIQMAARTAGGALADVVAAAVATEQDLRQDLLAELDPKRRLERVLSELGALIAKLPRSRPVGMVN